MSEETVVGWDGSVPSQRALEWALARAEARAEDVLIANVIVESDQGANRDVTEADIERAEAALEDVRRSAQLQHPRLSIRSRLLFGDPVQELRSLSDDETLVVIGTHSRNEADSPTAWSVGARLAASAYGPVAIIPETVGATDASRSGVVAGVDGSAASLEAARFAAAEAVRTGDVLQAVHAWQVPPAWADDQLDEESLHALEEVHRGILETAIDQLQREYPTLSIAKTVVKQPAMSALGDKSGTGRMLVLGNHGLKVAPRLALGPVSHSLVRSVHVPTVVVRANEHAL